MYFFAVLKGFRWKVVSHAQKVYPLEGSDFIAATMHFVDEEDAARFTSLMNEAIQYQGGVTDSLDEVVKTHRVMVGKIARAFGVPVNIIQAVGDSEE